MNIMRHFAKQDSVLVHYPAKILLLHLFGCFFSQVV